MNILSKRLRTLASSAALMLATSLLSVAAVNAQNAPAPAPNVESANIMDIQKGSDAAAQAAREKSQPGNNSPVWRAVNSDEVHYVSIPNKEAGVLIKKSGQDWRLFRNGVITVYGGWLLVLAVVGVIALHFWKGTAKLEQPETGRKIERFTSVERLVHWTMAFTFIGLAISGILILFGKHFLLPLIGSTLFGWLMFLMKNIHNIIGPLFTVSVVVFFVMFVKDNIPALDDLKWLFTKHHPAGRFNAGEKIWFWLGMTILGLTVSASGWVLDMIVPGLEYWRGTMQLANIIHGVAAILIIIFAMGHIYIGTIGTEGAIDGMKTGYVGESWAKQHHQKWYEDIQSGKIPASREPENSASTRFAKKVLRKTL